MRQKLLDKILYVFDVTPYEITEDADEATTIKVQQEAYDGFVELNPDLVSKIVKYNYHMFTVNKQEWADYVDEPDPVTKYNIILHGGDLQLDDTTYVCGYVNGEVTWLPYDYSYDLNQITIQYEAGLAFQIDERLASIGSYTPEDIVSSEDTLWDIGSAFIMPESDVELTLNAIPGEEPVQCTVTFTGSGANDNCINVEVGGALITDFTDYIVDPEAGTPVFTLNANEEIKIYPLHNQEDYSVICADADVNVDDQDQYYWYVAISNDTTITVDYTDPNAQ